MFLSVSTFTFVLWIHVLAACVWIGGQVAIGMVLPMLRGQPEMLRAAAGRFQRVAWIAYALLLLTGAINADHDHLLGSHLTGTAAGRTLVLKLIFVLLSGLAAAGHAYLIAPRIRVQSTPGLRAASGLLGAGSLLAAVAAALFGVQLGKA
jgi:putative copper export protein